METLIKHLLALIEKGAQPEIGFIQQKASKLRAFATAEGYGNIIESLFEHERNLENDGNSVLNWRLNKCNCGTRPLMSLINQQVTNILQTANPVMQEIEGRKPASTVMEILFEDFYAGKSMIEISDELVNEYGLHSPFDWLVLDIAGTYSEHDLPVLKPYIVSAQSLHSIEYENGEVSSLMYVLNEFEDEDDWATGVRYVFVNKDVTAIFTRTVQPGRSIENYEFDDELVDISPDDGVIVQGERERYKVVVSVRNLPAVPILPLGFVKLDSEPMFYGNEFCAVTELLERYARYDSEIVCIIDKYIKPEEIRLVEKPKPSLQAYSENDWEGGLKERSSLQGTEIEVDNLEDALEKGYLAHFDKMVIHLTPEFETLNKLIEQRASVKREIERTILGVEIFDRQQSGLTATEKRLELQAKENVASRRLRKQEEIINFLFYCSASIYKASLVKGFVNRDLPELFFSFPKRLQVQTAGELLEEYKKTREMGAPQDVVRNILRKYRHVVFSGDLKRIHEEEVWDMLNPFRNILPEDWWAKYENMNQNVEGGPGLWNSWQFVLAQYEPAIRVMAEERFPAFYTNPVYLQFEQARKIVEEFMVGMLNIELDTLPKESTEKVEDDIEGEQVNEETTKTEDDVLDTVEANTEKVPASLPLA